MVRSNRLGRVNAGSKTSARFVPAKTTIFVSTFNPPISTTVIDWVFSRFHHFQTASISSVKIIHNFYFYLNPHQCSFENSTSWHLSISIAISNRLHQSKRMCFELATLFLERFLKPEQQYFFELFVKMHDLHCRASFHVDKGYTSVEGISTKIRMIPNKSKNSTASRESGQGLWNRTRWRWSHCWIGCYTFTSCWCCQPLLDKPFFLTWVPKVWVMRFRLQFVTKRLQTLHVTKQEPFGLRVVKIDCGRYFIFPSKTSIWRNIPVDSLSLSCGKIWSMEQPIFFLFRIQHSHFSSTSPPHTQFLAGASVARHIDAHAIVAHSHFFLHWYTVTSR